MALHSILPHNGTWIYQDWDIQRQAVDAELHQNHLVNHNGGAGETDTLRLLTGLQNLCFDRNMLTLGWRLFGG